jgi:hypothetical protein
VNVRRILGAGLACWLVIVAGAAAQDPWVGVWRLDASRSSVRAEPSPYKRVTLRIESTGEALTVIYDMVGARGGVTHLEWTGRFDGRDYGVQGVDYVLTNAYRRLDDRRYEIIVKVDGRVVATATAAVSPDGDTLSVDTTETDARGRVVTTTAVYSRL